MQALLWGLRYPSFTANAHRRFGETFTVRVGGLAPSVVTVDREGIRRLFTGDPLIKRHASDQLKPLFGERSIVLLEPAEHLARRKLLLPSFHGEAMRVCGSVIERVTSDLIDDWSPGDVVEILPVAQRITLEVILELLLGPSDSETRDSVRGIFDSMVSIPGSSVAGYFPKLTRRSQWNIPAERYWRLRDSLDATLMAKIKEIPPESTNGSHGGIVPLMPRLRGDDGDGLSEEDIRDELKALITAGHETTATAISWGVELLAHEPAIQASARDAAEAGNTAYLDALVKEILRIRTPVPIGATRRITEPFELSGYVIPAGVPILVNAFGLHHDPELYPDPEALRVERFMGTSPNSYTYLPFGGGARRCIGSALAEMETRIVLAMILRRFKIEPTSSKPAALSRRGITLIPANKARVRLAKVTGA